MSCIGAQSELLCISMALKPGQAYGGIPYETIAEASIANLPLLDRMGGARRSDINTFVKEVEKNWDIRLAEDPFRNTWTMHKNALQTTQSQS